MNKELFSYNTWTETEKNEALQVSGPILIVGVSGFIGANLYYILSNLRDDVYGCSRNPQKSWRLAGDTSKKLINVDINDAEQIKYLIQRIKPQTVYNLAAYGAYSRQSDFEKIHQTNYIGTLNLIRALSETGCHAFIQSGTSSEYGLNCANPDEKDELVPNSDYAVSKVGSGFLIKYYGRIQGFPCINLRLYSVYGPWEERDRLIPTLVLNGLKGNYPHFVGKSISRDFVYIDDCNNAFVKAVLTVCRTHPGLSVNVASGIRTTLEDIAFVAQRVFNIRENPEFGSMPNRKWDLADWYGNPALAEELMGWKYKTSFEEGLRQTAAWQKKALEQYKYIPVPKIDKKISVVIACYKDNQSVPILYERLTNTFVENGYDYEIIFVNDNSPSGDEEVISRLCTQDNHVIGVSHSRNFGSQSAFISGMELATGDAVVLMDGDGQDPPELITDFIKKWLEGFDIVYGQRIKREAPFYMQVFYKLFYRVFKKVSDIKIPVDAGDFSLIDKKAVEYLLKFTEKDIFLRGLRAWIGFNQVGVSYSRPERLFGRSTNSFYKNIWWAKKGIFSFSTKPLQYIQTMGLIVFLITIAMAVFYLILYFIKPPINARGITTIILLMLGLGGVQLISISILGDYIGKIIEEVKNRPKFIRSKIIYNGKIYHLREDIEKILRDLRKK